MAVIDSIQANGFQAKRRRRSERTEEKSMVVVKRTTKHQVKGDIPVKPESRKKRRVTFMDACGDDQFKSAAMRQAIQVQATLTPEFPTMIKCMLPSHVTGGFWLGLARSFCNKHLPKNDTMMVLEDKDGEQYEAKYLAEKTGLSGGWRGFSIAHNLLVDDVLVFHLVKPTRFKVYIARAKGKDEKEGALSLLQLDASSKQANAVKRENTDSAVKEIEDLPLSKDSPEENLQKDDVIGCETNHGSKSDQSENESDDLGLELWDGIRLSDTSTVDFKDVKSFADFDILVNGLVITCELSENLQHKYYELCCNKGSFLHQHLVDGLNVKLAAGIIAETINISDAIRASKISASRDYFANWRKTLQAFETLGMNVGFLISRLDQLISLADKSKRYVEARQERADEEEELRSLEVKLLEVKDKINKLDREIKTWEDDDNAKQEVMFQEVAKAPW